MKVAVVFSGQVRGQESWIVNNISLAKAALSRPDNQTTFYGIIWSDEVSKYKSTMDTWGLDHILTYDHWDMHYHPLTDVYEYPYKTMSWWYLHGLARLHTPDGPKDRKLHQTQQILVHNKFVKDHGKDYDVIIRLRWDTTCGFSRISHWIPKVIEDNCWVIACARAFVFKDKASSIHNISWDLNTWDNVNYSQQHATQSKHRLKYTDLRKTFWIDDVGLIMHRTEDWNADKITQLHNDKQLACAEYGWVQVIASSSNRRFRQLEGVATLTRMLSIEDRATLNKQGYVF